MKRWLILMAMVVAMMSVASAKRVYYPNRWDDPLSARTRRFRFRNRYLQQRE